MPEQATAEPTPMVIDTPTIADLPPEEEDELVAHRLANDEKLIRRLAKRIQAFSSALQQKSSTPSAAYVNATVNELRQGAQVDLAALQLSIQKSVLVQRAEAMQAKEYEDETKRIEQERETAHAEISRLKSALGSAEVFHEKQKGYDLVAAKVIALPSRSELNASITELEDEIASIHAEQRATHELLSAKRNMMEDIRQRIQEMILHGRDSRAGTPVSAGGGVTSPVNKDANSFIPSSLSLSAFSRLVSTGSGEVTPAIDEEADGGIPAPEEGEDVEMGEVDESGSDLLEKQTSADASGGKGLKKRGGKLKEELEEGEASDGSSELTDLSDLPGGS